MHKLHILGGDGMNEKQWMVIRSVCGTDGAESTSTYGVRYGDWEWADVDTDCAVVQRLADRLNACRPEPCHYTDMVLDFIEERAGAD